MVQIDCQVTTGAYISFIDVNEDVSTTFKYTLTPVMDKN